MQHTHTYIYMDAKCERETDPENFSARIIEFRVVVGKI
jgi:hypothetical protein